MSPWGRIRVGKDSVNKILNMLTTVPYSTLPYPYSITTGHLLYSFPSFMQTKRNAIELSLTSK